MKVVPRSTATIISGLEVDAIVLGMGAASVREEGILVENKYIYIEGKRKKQRTEQNR